MKRFPVPALVAELNALTRRTQIVVPSVEVVTFDASERFDAVRKSVDEMQFSLGVAYPADEADGHEEFMRAETLEWVAWHWLAVHRAIGVQHQDGTEGHCIPVESYIYRGPDWEIADQIVTAGDWLLGGIWDDAGWSLVQRGIINGWSIQGGSERTTRSGEEVSDVEGPPA